MESLCPICSVMCHCKSSIVPQSNKAVGLLSEFHMIDVVSTACLYPTYFLIIQVVFFLFMQILLLFICLQILHVTIYTLAIIVYCFCLVASILMKKAR